MVGFGDTRLVPTSGVRKNEALTLRWDWVDWERDCLRLPESKTGAKVVPLGEPAMELLASLPQLDGSPYVFPSAASAGHLVGLQKVWQQVWQRIRATADLPDLRLHDLRHHFISVGPSSGESLYVLGKIAGHKHAATTQRYAHLADDPVRTAANPVARKVHASLEEPSKVDAVAENVP